MPGKLAFPPAASGPMHGARRFGSTSGVKEGHAGSGVPTINALVSAVVPLHQSSDPLQKAIGRPHPCSFLSGE